MKRWLRRVVAAMLAVIVVVIVVAVVVARGGTYDTYPRQRPDARVAGADGPRWARACRHSGDSLADACGRIRGRVVWIQRHDPDGDGDRHIVVIVRFRPRVIKIRAEKPWPLPALGRRVTAVGPMVPGASERRELDAQRLSAD